MSEVEQGDAATGNTEAPVKTAKQLEKEAKKAEKLAKLQAKQNKLAEKKAAEPAEKEVSLCHCEYITVLKVFINYCLSRSVAINQIHCDLFQSYFE